MRRLLTLVVLFLFFFSMTSCHKKPRYPLCEKDADCKQGQFCHNGRCVDCRQDSDCGEGMKCREGICVHEQTSSESEGGGKNEIMAGNVRTPYEECSLNTIYFDFDSAEIKPRAATDLKKTAECLMRKGAKDIVITGHCDPRGTEEYNMGLGLKRAKAIKQFLVRYGIPEGEITIYSKGEEEAEGYDEATWAKDRKGVIK